MVNRKFTSDLGTLVTKHKGTVHCYDKKMDAIKSIINLIQICAHCLGYTKERFVL